MFGSCKFIWVGENQPFYNLLGVSPSQKKNGRKINFSYASLAAANTQSQGKKTFQNFLIDG